MRYAVIPLALAVLAGCAQVAEIQETAAAAERRLDEASIERWCLKARLEPGELLERVGDAELAALITEACQRRAQAVSAAVRG